MFHDDLDDENLALKALNAAYIHGIADTKANALALEFDERTLSQAEHFADYWQDLLIARLTKPKRS